MYKYIHFIATCIHCHSLYMYYMSNKLNTCGSSFGFLDSSFSLPFASLPSRIKTFTRAYSNKPPKTNTKQVDIHTSMAEI